MLFCLKIDIRYYYRYLLCGCSTERNQKHLARYPSKISSTK